MLYHTIFHYIILYHIILYDIIFKLYDTILYDTILYCMILYYIILYYIILYYIILNYIILYQYHIISYHIYSVMCGICSSKGNPQLDRFTHLFPGSAAGRQPLNNHRNPDPKMVHFPVTRNPGTLENAQNNGHQVYRFTHDLDVHTHTHTLTLQKKTSWTTSLPRA